MFKQVICKYSVLLMVRVYKFCWEFRSEWLSIKMDCQQLCKPTVVFFFAIAVSYSNNQVKRNWVLTVQHSLFKFTGFSGDIHKTVKWTESVCTKQQIEKGTFESLSDRCGVWAVAFSGASLSVCDGFVEAAALPCPFLFAHLQQMAFTIMSDGGIYLAELSDQGHPFSAILTYLYSLHSK